MADPRGPSSRIELRVLQARHTASVRETVASDDVTEALGRAFQAVRGTLEKQGVAADGSLFARWHGRGDQVDVEAGIMVATAITPDGEVKPNELPGGPAVIAVHAGPYEGLKRTYDAMEAWLTRAGRSASGGPWEIYLTDPSAEPDPSRWLTEIDLSAPALLTNTSSQGTAPPATTSTGSGVGSTLPCSLAEASNHDRRNDHGEHDPYHDPTPAPLAGRRTRRRYARGGHRRPRCRAGPGAV